MEFTSTVQQTPSILIQATFIDKLKLNSMISKSILLIQQDEIKKNKIKRLKKVQKAQEYFKIMLCMLI